VPEGEGAVSGMVCGILRHLRPFHFRIVHQEIYLTRVRKIDSISVRTIYHSNLCFIGFLTI